MAVALVALIASIEGWACGARYQEASRIEAATVPPGDAVPPLDEPRRDAYSLQFTWEFDSHLTPSAYVDWVAKQLTQARFSVQRQERSLQVSRADDGDAYRVIIEPVGDAPTHIRVTLRMTPD